jgi:hypothetical protein
MCFEFVQQLSLVIKPKYIIITYVTDISVKSKNAAHPDSPSFSPPKTLGHLLGKKAPINQGSIYRKNVLFYRTKASLLKA